MNTDLRGFKIGRDSDDAATGLIIALVVILMIIATIVMIIFGLGAIIGGFYSIKNYIVAFKHNVIDSNQAVSAA